MIENDSDAWPHATCQPAEQSDAGTGRRARTVGAVAAIALVSAFAVNFLMQPDWYTRTMNTAEPTSVIATDVP